MVDHGCIAQLWDMEQISITVVVTESEWPKQAVQSQEQRHIKSTNISEEDYLQEEMTIANQTLIEDRTKWTDWSVHVDP